jgi:hypothetical protein
MLPESQMMSALSRDTSAFGKAAGLLHSKK